MSTKPRKPTEPFGHIVFGKDGSVTKHVSQLSHDKEEQESGVMEYFTARFNPQSYQTKINSFEKLPEADHDFIAITNNGPITIQVTELVERDYAKPITDEEYNKGIYSTYIQKGFGEIPWAVDTTLLNSSLKRSIDRKLNKNYAKTQSEILWLLIFSTSPYLLTEYTKGNKNIVSDALVEAQEYLTHSKNCVFDEIWYTNLQTRPVRVWPI